MLQCLRPHVCPQKSSGRRGIKTKIAVNSVNSYSSEKQYVSNIAQLDKVRLEWEATHINTCEVKLSAWTGWIYQERNPRCVDGVLKCTDLDQYWQYPRPVLSMRMCNTSYELTINWVTHGAERFRASLSCGISSKKSLSVTLCIMLYILKKKADRRKKIYSPFYFTLFITGNPSYPHSPKLNACATSFRVWPIVLVLFHLSVGCKSVLNAFLAWEAI